jgi:hypothetical protein
VTLISAFNSSLDVTWIAIAVKPPCG